jgi:hypothetical protein
MARPSFLSSASARMPVNTYLVLTFLCLLCFWTVLYFVTERAKILAESYAYTGFDLDAFEGQSLKSLPK